MLRLKAVEHQAQLCARAFGKHERAKERGEDIGYKEHQKRLKMGKPIQAVSVATRESLHDRLAQDFKAKQLEEVLAGNLRPLPAAAPARAPDPNPLCEPNGIMRPAQKREEPIPPARELRFDGYTAEARLIEPIGIDRMHSCAEETGGRYTPQSNASIIVYEKSGDLGATVTANTSGLLMCMGAPSRVTAERAIEAVAGRIGPVREGSFKITNITGGAHLGVEPRLSALATHLRSDYQPEFESCVTYRHGGATARIYGSGSVRVATQDKRVAMAAYLHVRKIVFTLRNDAMPEMPQYTWFVPASDDPVPAQDDLDDAASLAAMPPPDASQRTRIQKRGWALLHGEVTKRRPRQADDELATQTGDESLAMSTRSNAAAAWNAEAIVELEKCSWPGQDQLHSAGMGMVQLMHGEEAARVGIDLASALGVSHVAVPSQDVEISGRGGLLDMNFQLDLACAAMPGHELPWDTST